MAHAAIPDEISVISGTYAGRAYNGSNLDPVVTVLAFDTRGRFAGTYKVDDENGIYEGRLSNLIPEGNRAFSLEWTDQFGEGFVHLELAPTILLLVATGQTLMVTINSPGMAVVNDMSKVIKSL